MLARGGLLGGLIADKYLGSACPDALLATDEDLDSLPEALALVAAAGGWERVQVREQLHSCMP